MGIAILSPAPPPTCVGDCNSSGQVTVDELLTMVNIALGNLQVDACIAGDMNTDGAVTIDEILTAVNYALNGCPVPIVPAPTPSPTQTTPPSPSVTLPPVSATPSPTRTRTVTSTATATATRTVAASTTPTATRTKTQTVAMSATPSPTLTRTIAPASVTPMPTRTISGTPATPTRTPGGHIYCDTLTSPLTIPDNDEFGTIDQISISDSVPITTLKVQLQINHTWVGDLVVNLTHVETLSLITLISRPGQLQSPTGCQADNIACTFDDAAMIYADDQCASTPPAIGGSVVPTNPLSVFAGESSAGEWSLVVSDHSPGDTGTLVHWCLEVQ